MQRLTGLDAGYLYMETPTLHMHTLKISVLDPSAMPGGYSFGRVREELERRLHLLPPFRRRLVQVPFGIHHPLWIEDPDFDLDWHLHRVAVPPPGGQRQFCELISDIASHQLDRTRPLWEIWVVEGLEQGRVGFVAKLHHSVADGVAAAALLANVLTTDPSPGDPPPPLHPWAPEVEPSRAAVAGAAVVDAAKGLRRLPGLLRRTALGMREAGRVRKRHPEVPAATPMNTPRTPFNGSLTPHRIFATATVPLDSVKAVRKAFGVTVNDVVLGMSAGALVRYLDKHGSPPDKPLLAGVPVSVSGEPEDGPRLSGNRVSNLFVSLCTDVEDPVARLRAIHASSTVAKEVHQALGAEMLADWSELTPPKPFSAWMRLYSKLRLADHHAPPQNVVISNVPGPTEPLYITGARLAELYSVGPILEGIGLNITVWSYLGTLYIGLISCRELMPDLWDLASLLPEALDELTCAAAPV
ncbi:MAG TPA: wax ester/triacylglycerol synthase family O-acyltransferase [Acidimicrobiales bacterium]